MRRVAITGAEGFLGWHLSCRIAATRGIEPVRIGRADFLDPERLAVRLADVDTVFHLAGVNRADSEREVRQGNTNLARTLVNALSARDGAPLHVVYANSIQADGNSPYGQGKRQAADILAELPGTLSDLLLPNLFGEHGRPSYNSFVATFCHEVVSGRKPQVTGDREIPLMHAQLAAESLLVAAEGRLDEQVRPAGEPRRISQVLEALKQFHVLYASRGEIPDVSDTFTRDLFNTYRAALFPHGYPIYPQTHADPRGILTETARSHGGTSQSFASSTVPGATRGDHYHLHKIERFMVVRGQAEIALRRLYHRDVVRFRVSGDHAGFIDMPTMWSHNIRNIGADDLITVFWTDQLLDPEKPDQYPLKVEATA